MRLDPFVARTRNGHPLRFIEKPSASSLVFVVYLPRIRHAPKVKAAGIFIDLRDERKSAAADQHLRFSFAVLSEPPLAIRMFREKDFSPEKIFGALA